MRCERTPIDTAGHTGYDPLRVVPGYASEPPRPSPQFRRRAWREFQRAIDPLAEPRPLPPARQH